MRTLTTILILLLSLNIQGQEEVNQKTENGQKTGKWVEFYDNGKIKEVKHFKPVRRKLELQEIFMLGIRNNQDTIIYKYSEVLQSMDTYEYDDSWEFKRIKRYEASNEVVYLYGVNRDVGLRHSNYNLIGRVNSTKVISIILTNNTDKTIILTPELSSKNLITDKQEFVLPSKQSSTFIVTLTIEPNDNGYKLWLKNKDLLIEVSIQTYGYHIESKDIEKEQLLTVQKSFVYYRTGNEALLKLYDKDKKEEIKTISLAKERTIVDFKGIKSGVYWLSIVNFSLAKQTFCKVKIED